MDCSDGNRQLQHPLSIEQFYEWPNLQFRDNGRDLHGAGFGEQSSRMSLHGNGQSSRANELHAV